jgi:hypothetical protein
MPSVYVTAQVDLDELSDDELIEELGSRGYKIFQSDDIDDDGISFDHKELKEVFYAWRQKRRKDAMILLERIFPGLDGVSDFMA